MCSLDIYIYIYIYIYYVEFNVYNVQWRISDLLKAETRVAWRTKAGDTLHPFYLSDVIANKNWPTKSLDTLSADFVSAD